MTLESMLADPSVNLTGLAAWLDGMDHAGRMAALASSTKAQQSRLWDLAADAAPIDLEHFVPSTVPDQTEVIHHGRNTLPVFRSFQKRFSRGPNGTAFGYNEGDTRWLIGPGYFVLIPCAGNPEWEKRAPMVVDYFQVPAATQPLPAGWPAVRANHVGLQVLVYYHTRDFMRRVSKHVSIGMAYKNESSLNNWFQLIREDRA